LESTLCDDPVDVLARELARQRELLCLLYINLAELRERLYGENTVPGLRPVEGAARQGPSPKAKADHTPGDGRWVTIPMVRRKSTHRTVAIAHREVKGKE